MKTLVVGHGLDSYEEIIILSEVQFVIAGWTCAKGCQESGNWNANIYLKGRTEPFKVHFNERGWDDFQKALEGRKEKVK